MAWSREQALCPQLQDSTPGRRQGSSRLHPRTGTLQASPAECDLRLLPRPSSGPPVSKCYHFPMHKSSLFPLRVSASAGKPSSSLSPPLSWRLSLCFFKQRLQCPWAPRVFTAQKRTQTNIPGKDFGPGWDRGPEAFGLPENLRARNGHGGAGEVWCPWGGYCR